MIAVVALASVFAPRPVAGAAFAAAAALLVCSAGARARCVMHARRSSMQGRGISNVELLADAALPRYSVVVPLFGEPALVNSLVESLVALQYPSDRLEILLIVEQTDDATARAAHAAAEGRPTVRVVTVPRTDLRTKARALNYARSEAQGELITVVEVHQRPHPVQLLEAADRFAAGGSRLACLVSRSRFVNREQNLATGWDALDRSMLANVGVPSAGDAWSPLLLDGACVHVRRAALESVGGWDTYNVRPDVDLSLRLSRAGYAIAILATFTDGEANSDPVNLIRQRARWLRGDTQSWLVDARRSRDAHQSRRQGVGLVIGAGLPMALLRPVAVVLAGLLLVRPDGAAGLVEFLPAWTVGPAVVVVATTVLGYVGLILMAAGSRSRRLVQAALLRPAWSVLLLLSALKAVVQLAGTSVAGDSTRHGLAQPSGARLGAMRAVRVR